jgi:hypothetical protein
MNTGIFILLQPFAISAWASGNIGGLLIQNRDTYPVGIEVVTFLTKRPTIRRGELFADHAAAQCHLSLSCLK